MKTINIKKVCLILSITCISILVLVQMTPAQAETRQATLFVKPGGSGSACSQSHPCRLDTAMAQYADGDVLLLAGGLYTGVGTEVIDITRPVDLVGGWDGAPTGTVVIIPRLYPTILDGQDARRVVKVTGVTALLEGLVIQGGSSPDGGAGIRSENATLTLLVTG